MSINITGRASPGMSQAIQAVRSTINRLQRLSFQEQLFHVQTMPHLGTIAWNPPQ